MQFFLFLILSSICGSHQMEFTPYTSSEQYKCGSFLQNKAEDKTLEYYYSVVTQMISWISKPFPHAELLSDKALTGDLNEIQDSLRTKQWEWIAWQNGWMILAGCVLLTSIIYPVIYIIIRCCMCCFCSTKGSRDNRLDGCRRNLLNAFLAVFVLIDVFAAATLLITGQYAQYGLEELPNRLNHCVDDLNLYKRDTDMSIRKLLIDDFQTMNRTIWLSLESAGHNIVHRMKKVTGAQAVDTLIKMDKDAHEVGSLIHGIRDELDSINRAANSFEVEFSRLRKTSSQELLQCIQNETGPRKTMCHQAEQLLDNLRNVVVIKIRPDLLANSTERALNNIVSANMTHMLESLNSRFEEMEDKIQFEIDGKLFVVQNTLKRIGDDLFVVAETISTQIRQVNFDALYNVISRFSDPTISPTLHYIRYGWYVSLAITAVFILLALCFLFGLFYGVCGRRPSFYNDDCCVRTTGSKFLSCGVWSTILCFTVLGAFTSILLLVSGNSSSMICETLRDPFDRPDMLSLAERFVDKIKHEKFSKDFVSLWNNQSPADILRACQRNETFYQVFDFDKTYHLSRLKEFIADSHQELQTFVTDAVTDIPQISPVSPVFGEKELSSLETVTNTNLTLISHDALHYIKSAIIDLDLLSKARAFEKAFDRSSGRPKSVSSILEQLEEIDVRMARPLRLRLDAFYKKLTDISERLSELQLPIASLVTQLEHAQALLSVAIANHLEVAAKEEFNSTMLLVDEYVVHVRKQMSNEVSSCSTVVALANFSTAAICSKTIDPLSGASMAMLVGLFSLVFLVVISTCLNRLYNKMHSFPKYTVETPHDSHHLSSFITDTYDTRQKPGYANYCYTDDYQRTYR